MPPVLSHAERARYLRDGVLFPLAVLPASQARCHRAAVRELRAAIPDHPDAIRWSSLCFSWAYDLAVHPCILDAVECLLGPELVVWGTLIVSKPADSSRFVSWHQDGAYAPLDVDRSVTAWVALTESDATNGCVRIVPGSHRHELSHRRRSSPDNQLDRGQEVELEIDESAARDIVLAPGEMSLHHFNAIHGSRANRSDVERIGYVIRFTTPSLPACGFPVVRARGRHPCRHLRLAQRPPENRFTEGLQLHAHYERNRRG